MIRLNRTTEYGLMALRHISRKSEAGLVESASAREIADAYGLPFEITAKTLQRLKEKGLIQSTCGAKGGYTLGRSLKEVSLAEFLELMEGPQSIVACTTGSSHSPAAECEYGSRCEIKNLMNQLNHRVFHFLSGIHLAEFVQSVNTTQPVVQIVSLTSEPVSLMSPHFEKKENCT